MLSTVWESLGVGSGRADGSNRSSAEGGWTRLREHGWDGLGAQSPGSSKQRRPRAWTPFLQLASRVLTVHPQGDRCQRSSLSRAESDSFRAWTVSVHLVATVRSPLSTCMHTWMFGSSRVLVLCISLGREWLGPLPVLFPTSYGLIPSPSLVALPRASHPLVPTAQTDFRRMPPHGLDGGPQPSALGLP